MLRDPAIENVKSMENQGANAKAFSGETMAALCSTIHSAVFHCRSPLFLQIADICDNRKESSQERES